MAQGKNRTVEQWQDLIEQYLQSGLTVEQFAKQANISKSTLYKWLNRFHSTLEAKQKPFISLPAPRSSPSIDQTVEFTYQTPAGATLQWRGTPPQDYLFNLIGRLP